MSYQVLARKYRPSSFAEMVGQQHVLKALINALEADRLHHAYLFAGTRGVGKTTIGRILAKCLNCAESVTSTPCGTCGPCVEISGGRSVDLIEVDAASQRGVEETQQLLENVQYMPTRDRFKVYLIDEVHMLTAHSFNALLKTLEEPPPHVKFLLATTEPKRLPVTVLSRCLQFNLKNMTTEEVVGHLHNVLETESIGHDDGALWLLGRAADGSMRDALSLTDQAIAYSGEQVSERDVRAMLGAFDHGAAAGLLTALVDHDADGLLNRVAGLSEFAPSYEALLDDLLRLLHRVAVGQYVPASIDNSEGDAGTIAAFCERISPEDVQLYYQIGVMGQRDLPLAPDPRAGFEMVLLRMLAFTPDGPDADTAAGPVAGNVRSAPGTSTPGASRAEPTGGTSDPPPPANPAEMGPAAERAAQLAARGDQEEARPKSESAASDDRSIAAATEPDVAAYEVDREQLSSAVPTREPAGRAVHPGASFRAPAESGSAHTDDDIWADSPESSAPPREVGSARRDASEVSRETSDKGPEDAEPADVSADRGGSNRQNSSDRSNHDRNNSDHDRNNNSAGHGQESAAPIAPTEPAIEQQWFDMTRDLDVSGVTQVLASHCYFVGDQDGVVHLRIEREHATLWNRSHERRMAEALGHRLGGRCRIEVSIGPVPGNTPAMLAARERERVLAQAVEVIEENDNIRALLADFDGTLIRETIEPRAQD